jgi:REP element-mobilizing transposase RayT
MSNDNRSDPSDMDRSPEPNRDRKGADISQQKPNRSEPNRDRKDPNRDRKGADLQSSQQKPNRSEPNRDRKGADMFPSAYLITVRCYGTRLLGDEKGSVHHSDNIPGTPLIPHKPGLKRHQSELMYQLPYEMDQPRRTVVLQTIKDECKHRGWELYAAHVREEHWHAVIQANCRPEIVMNTLKSYVSRRLNEHGFDGKDKKRWARHGSTRYIWDENDVDAAIHYVVREQGDPIECYERQ